MISEQLQRIADKQQLVYEAGFAAGSEQGGGGDSWDSFWDFYQNNGKRTIYDYAFCEYSSASARNGDNFWSRGGYTPKYKIKPTNSYGMFRYFAGSVRHKCFF